MKKLNLIILSTVLAFGIVFSGCKKDDDDPIPDPTPACTNVISQEMEIYDDGINPPDTVIKVYSYNASKKLIKITSTFSYGLEEYDTIAYNGSGEIYTVKSYYVGSGTPYQQNTYTYGSGKITSVYEEGNNGSPYGRTRSFTYNNVSGQLESQAVVYTVGSGSGGGPENISSIVFTAGNPTSVDLGIPFGGAATLTFDVTAPNPYLGLNNDSEDILKIFAANNATSAYSDATGPGTPFFTRTYTYANGRVSTIVETNGSSDTSTTTITYACI